MGTLPGFRGQTVACTVVDPGIAYNVNPNTQEKITAAENLYVALV